MRWEEIMHPIFGRSLYVTDERSELTVPLAYGIRIARFSLVGGQNVFFEQPKDMKEFTTEEGWRLYGGHRLWIAPECDKDYYPDNDKITYEAGIEKVILRQIDVRAEVEKSIEISFGAAGEVHLVHGLKNLSQTPMECALWAVSSMAPGGEEEIRLDTREGGMDHWHRISMWDYTSLGDERAHYERDCIRLTYLPLETKYKIGVGHPKGGVTYANQGLVFTKEFPVCKEDIYPDGNVSYETFFCKYMVEMESLSPMCHISPGESAYHEEIWKLSQL